jgi:hypothetical protein
MQIFADKIIIYKKKKILTSSSCGAGCITGAIGSSHMDGGGCVTVVGEEFSQGRSSIRDD